MGQQMYVIHNNPTPGSKAQASYLDRLTKHVTQHGKVRRRSEKTIVKAIVAKGRDRNEFERKFINALGKAGLAAQADGTVVKSESQALVETEDGTTTTAAAARRQQPKRQTKAQRQSGAKQGDTGSATSLEKSATSLEKSDEPQDAKPAAAKQPEKPSSGTRSRAQSGQRKGGPQRPKSPSKK
jgi:YidC/Oxa1 family membrane protein insertase